MVLLKEIPFIMAIAEFLWGADADAATAQGDSGIVLVSASRCLDSLPFLSLPCFQKLIVKALGIGIILGAFLNKAPILVNMWNAQSAAGMAKASVYGEVIMYSNAALYGLLEGYPITAYGENLALTIQSLLIVLLLWKFSSANASVWLEATIVSACILSYWLVCMYVLPAEYYSWLMGINTPILIYARGSQVLQNFRDRHTGTQALVTLMMNLAGGLIRIGTTIAEVGWDIPTLSGFGTGVVLGIILLVQYFAYQANTQKVLAEAQEMKKQKKNKQA